MGKGRVGQRQAGPAGGTQVFKRGAQGVPVEGLARQGFVVIGEAGFGEAHARRQLTKDLGVGLGLAERRDRRLVEHHIGVAISGVHVQVFELGGGRQHVVGVVGGVGEEVFQHHGEQVVTGEAGHHLLRLGRHRHRVAVVDDQGLDLRAERGRGFAQQVVADGAHVDGAQRRCSLRAGQPCRALQRGAPEGLEPARAGQQQAASTVAPGPRQARQERYQTGRAAAALDALHAVVQPNRSRLGGAQVARQATDLVDADAANRGGARRRPLGDAQAQCLEAIHMLRDVVVVEPIVRQQFMHHAQRQSTVRTRQQGDVLMALLGRLGAARVDGNQFGAAPLGLLGQAPEVQVAGDGVAAPDDDQFAFGKEAGVHADLGAIGRGHGSAAGHGADGAVEQRGAELVEEARRHRLALQQAHGAGIAVGQDGLRVARGNRLQACGNVAQRFVPRHANELAAALGADALERVLQALGVVGALGVAADLGAQHALRGGVRRIALDAHHTATLHGDAHGAGVGAVVRTGHVNGARGALGASVSVSATHRCNSGRHG